MFSLLPWGPGFSVPLEPWFQRYLESLFSAFHWRLGFKVFMDFKVGMDFKVLRGSLQVCIRIRIRICIVGSSSQADCLLRNSAMDDSIGGS